MKKLLYLPLILLLLNSCSNEQKQSGLPIIDVNKTYPKKEIVLQDIADVEYIPLETIDDVLLSSSASIDYIAKDIIVLSNASEGDIFMFDGKGKLLNKFNHKGQGANEYNRVHEVIYMPSAKEIFVYGSGKPHSLILVYNMQGKFQREMPVKTKQTLNNLKTFNKNEIIAYEESAFPISEMFPNKKNAKKEKYNPSPMFLVSKATGVVDTIKSFCVPNRKSDLVVKHIDGMPTIMRLNTNSVSAVGKDFVLDNLFCDTVYLFNQKRELKPIFIKSPAVKDMGDTPRVMMIKKVSENYCFALIGDYDLKLSADKKHASNEYVDLCIDRNKNDIFEYTLKNREIDDKEFKVHPYSKLLNADDLIELLEDGKLTGKLKTIAEKLKEDDNPVLVKVTLK